jgi:selenoprotein W-related protein
LVEGGGGIFDVAVDGGVVFSKAEAGRFPEEGEVVALIRDYG